MLPAQPSLARVPCLLMGQLNLISTLSDGNAFLRSESGKRRLLRCLKNLSAFLNAAHTEFAVKI